MGAGWGWVKGIFFLLLLVGDAVRKVSGLFCWKADVPSLLFFLFTVPFLISVSSLTLCKVIPA